MKQVQMWAIILEYQQKQQINNDYIAKNISLRLMSYSELITSRNPKAAIENYTETSKNMIAKN